MRIRIKDTGQLHSIVMSMRPNEQFVIDGDDFRHIVWLNHPETGMFLTVNDNDINDFINKIYENWGVEITKRYHRHEYVLTKL